MRSYRKEIVILLLLVPESLSRHQGRLRPQRTYTRGGGAVYISSGKSRVYTKGRNKRRTVYYTKQSKEDETYREKEDGPGIQHQVDACTVYIDGTYKPFSCDEGEYCHLEYGECNDDLNSDTFYGMCREIISRCTREFKPVCGCDGRTYANQCVALSKGVSVKHVRPCMG